MVESPGRLGPGAKIRLPPIGFWSYARQDDDLSQGKLSGLRSLLIFELQQQHGRDQIQIFQDARTIPHGAAWEREIKAALDLATFFIPIITPNFVQSDWCCREVALFLEREAELQRRYPDLPRRSRIFPIQFIDIEDVDAADPAALAALQSLQWFDFRKFRHRSYESETVREAIADLAGSMRDLLKIKVSANGDEPTVPPIAAEAFADAEANEASHAPTIILPPEAPGEAAAAPPPPKPQHTARPIEVGDILNHIFEVKRFIKAGGMGQVFEGSNVITGERVAIKALLPALAADPKVIGMLQRESMTLTRLQHEALVQYRMLAKEPEIGVLYIVTEYIEGVDLGDVLDEVDRSPEALAALLTRLASGLAAAHRLGAIHRDISPDNVMLPGGDLQQAKIIDFGIAKDLAGALPTIIGDGFAGKLNFVAPEQLGEHDGEIGPWTDVYSLALVILSVAGGQKVDMAGSFADAIRKRREGVDTSSAPDNLRPLLDHMLRIDPAERLRTMDDVIAQLAEAKAARAREAAERRAERERQEAEKRAEQERQAEAELERQAAEQRAEQERQEAEARAEREREAAEKRAEQERRAEAERQAELERQAAEQRAEQERREAEARAEREREAAEQRAEQERRAEAERYAELERQTTEYAAAAAEEPLDAPEAWLHQEPAVRPRWKVWAPIAVAIIALLLWLLLRSPSESPVPPPEPLSPLPEATAPTQPPALPAAPNPTWLFDRPWGLNGQCDNPVRYSRRGNRISSISRGYSETINSAPGSVTENEIRTNRNIYRRNGPNVDVTNPTFSYTLTPCR